MVRLATIEDAQQLFLLNEEFNGEGDNSIEKMKETLLDNPQEIVVVAEAETDAETETEGGHKLAGFVCAQLKKSFCYRECGAEITEVYVRESYRRQGLAGRMITFMEKRCMHCYGVREFELKTGERNFEAQALYNALGYQKEDEILLRKIQQ